MKREDKDTLAVEAKKLLAAMINTGGESGKLEEVLANMRYAGDHGSSDSDAVRRDPGEADSPVGGAPGGVATAAAAPPAGGAAVRAGATSATASAYGRRRGAANAGIPEKLLAAMIIH